MLSQISRHIALAAGLVAVAGLSGCSARSGGYCHKCSPHSHYSMAPTYGYSTPLEYGHSSMYPTPAPPSGTYYHGEPVYGAPHQPPPAPPAVEPLPDSVPDAGPQALFRTPKFLQPVSNRVRDLVDRIRN